MNSVEPGNESLVQQVSYLRHKLDDEHASYKRKLQAYQDGQQRQAQLIQKLQAKVGKINLVVIACLDVASVNDIKPKLNWVHLQLCNRYGGNEL